MSRPLPSPNPLRRALFFAAGCLTLLLGALGMLLPLLPTTPFLLLAAGCFSRSSPRFHHWLLHNPAFGPVLQQWKEKRTIPPGVKPRAQLVVVVSFALSIAMVDVFALRMMLLVFACLVLGFLSRLSTEDAHGTSSRRQRQSEDQDAP